MTPGFLFIKEAFIIGPVSTRTNKEARYGYFSETGDLSCFCGTATCERELDLPLTMPYRK